MSYTPPQADPNQTVAHTPWADRQGVQRFATGEVLQGRYRIVKCLGKGAMGEVYQADDLRLHQVVALKFLPGWLTRDPALLARLHQEVRIARQITHQRICRVHDIVEAAGESFLTMECIDGEDLASLLRRIERVPQDKGLQLAHQLCEGLAALHAQGILHRDLKPKNIMIDCRGDAKLTDFGLAALAEAIQPSDFRAGTPAYMAPELLVGQPPSTGSDIFSLGLVIYEMFTGKRAFPAKNILELHSSYQRLKPTPIAELVSDIDPRIDRIVRRCLERELRNRPHTCTEVAAALPLHELQAAAAGRVRGLLPLRTLGNRASLRPAPMAALLWVVAVIGFGLVALLADRSTLIGVSPLPYAPRELAAKAQAFHNRLGYVEAALSELYGFHFNFDYLSHAVQSDLTAHRWDDMRSGKMPAIHFWLRRSPQFLLATRITPRTYPGQVTAEDPPDSQPGSTFLLMDTRGRLLEFSRTPDRTCETSVDQASASADFMPFFEEARLNWATATPLPSTVAPPFFADRRLSWSAAREDFPSEQVVVEAAVRHDKVVYFKVYHGAWEHPQPTADVLQPETRMFQLIYSGLYGLALLVSGWIAARNLRLGIGDVAGTIRLATFLFVIVLTCSILVADHVVSFRHQVSFLMKAIGFAAFWSGLNSLLYFVIEPFVRRRWPWRLTSWSSVLRGRWMTPTVGRDILIGAILGSFLSILLQLAVLIPGAFNDPPPLPLFTWPTSFTKVPFHLLSALPVAIRDALLCFFILYLLVLFVRKEWLAGVLVIALVLVFFLSQESEFHFYWASLLTIAVAATIFVALRFGLLSQVSGLFFCYYLYQLPLSLNLTGWYGWQSVIYLTWPVLLTGVALVAARGESEPD